MPSLLAIGTPPPAVARPAVTWRPRRDGAPPGDGSDLSPEARERVIDEWRVAMRNRGLATSDPRELLAIGAEARERLAEPGLTDGAKASLHISLSSVYGRLTELRVDTLSNGSLAFQALSAAVRLAPAKAIVAESYGRILLSFAQLNFAARFFVTTSLGIDLSEEVRKSLEWLAASPDYPMNQVLRVRLATWLGDKKRLAAAREALAGAERANPEGIAAAIRDLDRDKERAEASKAKGGA